MRSRPVFRTGVLKGCKVRRREGLRGSREPHSQVHSSERWITRLAGRGRPRRTARRNVNRRTNRTSTRRTHMAPAETTLRRFARSRVGILCTGAAFPGSSSSSAYAVASGLAADRGGGWRLFRGSPLLSTLPLSSVTSVKLAVLPDRWPCCWKRVDRSYEVWAVVLDFFRFPNSWRPVLCVPFVSPRRTIRRCTLLVLLSSAVESLRPV